MVDNPYVFKKTSDPGVPRNFDRSVKLFREGIRVANNGDLTTANSKVVVAYLIDTRCAKGHLYHFYPKATKTRTQKLLTIFLYGQHDIGENTNCSITHIQNGTWY